MKTMLVMLALMLTAGCAHAVPVSFDWTNPTWNAGAGQCGPAAGDTLKDLSSSVIYVQQQGRTDSVLVYTGSEVGRQGQVRSVTVDLLQGFWNAWIRVWNASGRSSCRSNYVTRVVLTTPAAPVLR